MEELIGFLDAQQPNVRKGALSGLLQFARAENFDTLVNSNLIEKVSRLTGQEEGIGHLAWALLVNLSGHEPLKTQMVDNDIVQRALEVIIKYDDFQSAYLSCMVLSNLTTIKEAVDGVMLPPEGATEAQAKLLKGIHLLRLAKSLTKNLTAEDHGLDHLSSVLWHTTANADARAVLVKQFPRLPAELRRIFDATTTSVVRAGIIGTLRNLVFDSVSHPALLAADDIVRVFVAGVESEPKADTRRLCYEGLVLCGVSEPGLEQLALASEIGKWSIEKEEASNRKLLEQIIAVQGSLISPGDDVVDAIVIEEPSEPRLAPARKLVKAPAQEVDEEESDEEEEAFNTDMLDMMD